MSTGASDLIVVITDAAGNTKTLDSNAPNPADRPRAIQLATQIQSGFYTASFTLRRPIDQDNIDLHLGDSVQIVGVNGEIRWEGFIQALPRSMDDTTHTLSVTCAGWMAHASDKSFTQIFVDRDLGQWGGDSSGRKAVLYAASYGSIADPSIASDPSGRAAVRTVVPPGPWTVTQLPVAEAFYDAGPGNAISQITGDWTRGPTINAADANWDWRVFLGSDGILFPDATAGLRATGPGSFSLSAAGTRRYALMLVQYIAASASTGVEFPIDWSNVAVYGDTAGAVALVNTAAPFGVTASDVIKYLAGLYCPLLDTSGVQTTTYPISHLVFRDRTKPYDAFLKVNSYHLWKLGVWENKRLEYEQIDLTDYDWEIRHDEAGNQIGLQGDDLAGLRNEIVVQFPNAATGLTDVLLPEDHAELRDDSIDNPYTQHGRENDGDPYIVPFPTTAADALQLGRLQLLQDNQPKAPGSFTVAHQIRDRSGSYQPVSAVRAGDRIKITSSANLSDRPRLIQETQYSDDGKTVTIAVDSTLRYLEAYVDRVQTALQANNLS